MSDYIPQLKDRVTNSPFYKFGSFTGTVTEVLFAMVRVRFDDNRTEVVLGNRFVQLVSRPGNEPKLVIEVPIVLKQPEIIPPELPDGADIQPIDEDFVGEPEKAKKPGSKS